VLASAGFGMLTAPIIELHNQKGYFLHHIIFARYSSDKELITRVYGEPKQINSKRINNSINKWANGLNR
jgi:hypothetical protein